MCLYLLAVKAGILRGTLSQEEATKLVSGKMKDLGSKDKVTAQKAKQKVTLPKKAIKPAKELINKENVKQYNIGSIEEIQAVVNNSKAGDNIIFTIDENTAERFSFAGYKDWFIQTYNLPGYTIEVGEGINPLSTSQFDKIYSFLMSLLS